MWPFDEMTERLNHKNDSGESWWNDYQLANWWNDPLIKKHYDEMTVDKKHYDEMTSKQNYVHQFKPSI